MVSENKIKALVALGFSTLEAEVYVALLHSSPATGYGVAQLINKPLSNVYKTIESLENKGAILVDDGESRMCRAVPVQEILSRLERSFRKNKQRAATALSQIKGSSADDRVYQLRSCEQVLERCRQMLQSCRSVVLIDAFPDILEELRVDIEAIAVNGRQVGIKSYLPIQIEGAEIFISPTGQTIVNRWAGQWLCLVVDGTEFLMAFLSQNGSFVHQAIWSESPFISWVYYSALYAELVFSRIHAQIEKGAASKELQDVLETCQPLWDPETRGYQELINRFMAESD